MAQCCKRTAQFILRLIGAEKKKKKTHHSERERNADNELSPPSPTNLNNTSAAEDRASRRSATRSVAEARESLRVIDDTLGPRLDEKDIIIEEELGRGCFGSVYRGLCCQKEVAIKIPFSAITDTLSPEKIAELTHEIEIMRTNPHPNICLYMGCCTSPRIMIVTELLEGNVEKLLLNDAKVLSLYTRMKMAKDAALGMTWLHRNHIIHRDLKPANLLYSTHGDEQGHTKYHVKVCDFGLSAIKPRNVPRLQDKTASDAKGTPLWMAPEVLRGAPFDTKADVYAFGIVLWQFDVRSEPFEEFEDFDEFRTAVVDRGVRPPIRRQCPPSMARLMTRCWDADPEKRPTMEEVASELDGVAIDAALADLAGNRLWRERWPKDESVAWDVFAEAFYAAGGLGRVPTHSPNSGAGFAEPDDAVSKLLCLKELLVTKAAGGEERVDIERFGHILEWFGPLEGGGAAAMLDRIQRMLSRPWFHGDVDSKRATQLLNSKPPGTFLVRFSSSPVEFPGCFTISRVSHHGAIGHLRVYKVAMTTTGAGRAARLPAWGYSLGEGDEDPPSPDIETLVRQKAGVLNLHLPCPGSPYAYLFAGVQKSLGYEMVTE